MKNFDDIRPYRDGEFENTFAKLSADNEFVSLLKYLFKDKYIYYIEKLKTVKTLNEFQCALVEPIIKWIISISIDKLSYSGIEKLDINTPALFISNHRDIVMDPSLISYGTFIHNLPTVEIAIGSNLLIKPWIEILVKLNKAFVVNRDKVGRELLLSSLHLSEYISHSALDLKNFIWIAQREGRAKDGNDRTQSSLLRMLTLTHKNIEITDTLINLNITPVSISYEYDPCDGLKAQELYMKDAGKDFSKTPQMDLQSMELGIRGKKGEIQVHFSNSISEKIKLLKTEKAKVALDDVAKIIDDEIYKNYIIYDTNKVAYNLFTNSNTFLVEKQKEEAIKNYFMSKLKSVGLDQAQMRFILMQYANPLINQMSISKR